MPTLARQKHTPRERAIAKQLGLSDAQLDALLLVRSGRWPYAAEALKRKGLAERHGPTVGPLPALRVRNGYGYLTPAGEALLARARALGF
jgi:hypothetical protein